MLKTLLLLLVMVWPQMPATIDSTDLGCTIAVDPDPPSYYKIDLVSTRRVPGSGNAAGIGSISYQATPFGIAISPDGSYMYDLDLKIEGLLPARKGKYVAWITTPDIKQIKRLGAMDDTHRISGVVDWNKFLVVISLEEEPSESKPKWKGPIVLRGLSRSGYMHTMAGHGPYESEPCAVYGY